jgi:hypothetical protein
MKNSLIIHGIAWSFVWSLERGGDEARLAAPKCLRKQRKRETVFCNVLILIQQTTIQCTTFQPQFQDLFRKIRVP